MFLRSYIINPTMDPKGNLIGGSIGFLKSLQKVCNDFKPDEVINVVKCSNYRSLEKELHKQFKKYSWKNYEMWKKSRFSSLL